MAHSLRKRVFDAIEPGDDIGVGIDHFIVGLIVVNVLAFVAETVSWIHALSPAAFEWFEWFSVAVFTLEYILRVWTAPERPGYTTRAALMRKPIMLIDLVSILPTYLVFLGIDMRVIRVFRMLRILRLAKLIRYMQALDYIADAIAEKKHELVASLILLSMVLLIAASGMYFLEHDAQPEAFSSIPKAMWWAVVTLTTVGYGGVIPVTVYGQWLAAIIMVIGLGFFAIPTSILSAAFMNGVERQSLVEKTGDKT